MDKENRSPWCRERLSCTDDRGREEDRKFFTYFRSVFKRYNISPSKATRLEYDFVTRVAESEFYLQKTNA